MQEKTITVLGSTGSIGKSTIDVLQRHKEVFKVKALQANVNVKLLSEQAKSLNAEMAVVADESKYSELKEALKGTDIKVASGISGVLEAASMDSDITMAAIVGSAGLLPAAEVIKRGKTLALANKETLVCAGEVVMDMVASYESNLIPVDSEHSAIFQCLNQEQRDNNQVKHLILTASGGPFKDKDPSFMKKVTPEEAVAHPNWQMGAKISVDSASMMNKGLEVIEAFHLFGLPEEKIKVVIHPQSIIHSAVAYIDGSVIAQMGCPDMRTPISYALGFPDRITSGVDILDLASVGSMSFFEPDEIKFPALRLAKEALRIGSSATNALNAANEVAVSAFLNRQIGFLDIVKVVESVLEQSTFYKLQTIEDAVLMDKDSRELANKVIEDLKI